MKKVFFFFLLSLSFGKYVLAFDIDIQKVSVDRRANQLITNLNKTYQIETPGFSNQLLVDVDIEKFTKEVVQISLSSSDYDTKRKAFVPYMYYSETDGAETLSGNLFLEMYLKQLEEEKMSAEDAYIKDIQTVSFRESDAMSFAYLRNVKVDQQETEVILAFWLKKSGDSYRVYYPWLTMGDDLEAYFQKVTHNEETGEVVGGTYRQVSFSGEEETPVSSEELTALYQKNKNKVVQITGMFDGGEKSYGSGFFLREGIVVTTWSLFLQILSESDYVYVNDVAGNTYDVLGVVAAQVDYDVVVLKINKNMGTGVTFGTAADLQLDDKLFMINSKNNSGFSIHYGSFLSMNQGRLHNMFLLNASDVGGALFTSAGNVVGIAVSSQLNSELSYANSTDYLKKLQTILNGQDYSRISYTLYETFKQNYYTDLNTEKQYNTIPKDVWDTYKEIGDIGTKITLPLVKASYVDNIVSLRYENSTSASIDSMYLISDFTDSLLQEGYQFTYSDSLKKIYKNKQYKIIIKNNLGYLIVLIMEN